VVTTGAIRRAKLQSNRHHQQTDIQLTIGRMPFRLPNQSTKGKINKKNTENKPNGPSENC